MASTGAKGEAPGAIRTTWRVAWNVLWRQHRKLLFALAGLSILLGILPTLESQLGSGVISIIDNVLDEMRRPGPVKITFGDALDRPLPRSGTEHRDVLERFSLWLIDNATLRNVALGYLATVLATFLVAYLATKVRATLGQAVVATLRERAMRNALMLDTTGLRGVNAPGQYASAIQQGAENVAGMYQQWFRIVEEVLAVVVAVIAIWSKDWRFSVLFLIIAVALSLTSYYQQKRLRAERLELDARRNELLASTDDVLSKREILAAYEQQERYTKRVSVDTWQYADVGRRLDIAEGKFGQISEALMDTGQLLVLFTALAVVIYTRVPAETDSWFIILLYGRLLRPTSRLISHYTSLKRSEATAATFLNVFAYESEAVPSPAPPKRSGEAATDIRFDRVSFAYPPHDDNAPAKQVLNDVSFEVPGGVMTLILGPSGCGKSTIARILLGFCTPDSGTVTINGRDIRDPKAFPDRHAIRELMSYVAQGDHVVDDTVRENLSWATRATPATDDDMKAVLAKVRLAGVDLGDRAKNLSLGQQQRLSVARLMLDESPIVVLDEPLSGADVFTSADLLPRLKEALHGRTALIISHKLSLAALARHVIVLDEKGNVTEEGAPAALLKKGDRFAAVYNESLKELQIAT